MSSARQPQRQGQTAEKSKTSATGDIRERLCPAPDHSWHPARKSIAGWPEMHPAKSGDDRVAHEQTSEPSRPRTTNDMRPSVGASEGSPGQG